MQAKTILRCSKTLITNLLALFICFTSFAQAPLAPQSAFDYLTAQEGATIALELDLTDLINSKNTNQYFPGSLTAPDGKMLKVEVRPRGKFRRKICDIPPLKLKFPKKALRAIGLDTLNEIKLVVPCFSNPNGEELLLREYVAYRMYEQINPKYSVRARLVKVAFRDKHVEQVKSPVYCILVEHEEQVAARLHGKMVEEYGLTADSLQTEQAALTAVFEYMIGNTDWAIKEVRNVYFLQQAKGEKMIPIPYDFDFAGLVNAPYATPKADMGLKNVKERRLLSGNIPKADLRKAVETIKSAQTDLILLCNAEFLSKGSVKEMNRYIDAFFQNIDAVPDMAAGKGKGNLR